MTYKVVFTPGGKWQGAGSYLANVSIHPHDIYVGWGFDFDARVEVEQVINLGSVEEPVAGMQISLEWDVNTPMNTSKRSSSWMVLEKL